MSLFTKVDLSKLPPPSVIEKLDYQTILKATKTELQGLAPELTVEKLPESDPVSKLLQILAYREMHLRQRINEAAKGVMLATAGGSNLDNLAALVNVTRLQTHPGDPNASPPVAPSYENDERLRARTQLAFEGFSTAGPQSAYMYHAMSASASVKDVAVHSDKPGEVEVRILSSENNNGVASQTLLDKVKQVLNQDTIRPITDLVHVNSAEIVSYSVNARLILYPGVGAQQVLQSAQAACQAFVTKQHRLGVDITRAGLFAALHQPGVQNVTLTTPSNDVQTGYHQAAYCSAVTVDKVEQPTHQPVNPAAAISFSNAAASGFVAGSVTITMASDEYDITHYVLYWGANNAEKLPQGVKRYRFDAINGTLTLDNRNIQALLITSDDGQTIYLPGKDYSVDSATGQVTTVNHALKNTMVRISYALPPIAEIAKTSALSYSFAANTAKPTGATHLLVFTRNEYGEMREGVSCPI